ncbi:MAG: hypothetical protein A4E56_00857 [Pelotomaculum sp. PtaU1.Bin065]|nr:MAG: hypothetical protein A4E56_00857 [Pelotomaculum sp. PtaU1.Bin065]
MVSLFITSLPSIKEAVTPAFALFIFSRMELSVSVAVIVIEPVLVLSADLNVKLPVKPSAVDAVALESPVIVAALLKT